MAISPALRGIILILALLDKVGKTFEMSNNDGFSETKIPSVFYLTGQVVAAYNQVRLTPHVVGPYRQDFACLREAASAKAGGPPQGRDFAKLNLHLPACRSLGAGRTLFEQPGKLTFSAAR